MGYDLSNLITQGFQNSTAARDKSFQNLASGMQSAGAGVKSLRQKSWNNENDRLMDEWYSLQGPQEFTGSDGNVENFDDILDPEFLQMRSAQNEMQRRLHNLKGHSRGLQTNYTPQDYLKLDMENAQAEQAAKAALAKQQADEEAAAAKRRQEVADKFNDSDGAFFDAEEELRTTKDLSPETRQQALSALLDRAGVKSPELKLNFMGELDKDKAQELRKQVLNAVQNDNIKFKKYLEKALKKDNLSLMEALPLGLAALAEGKFGKDEGTMFKIQKIIDDAYNDPELNSAIINRGLKNYRPEQIEVGREIYKGRKYPQVKKEAPVANNAEDF